MRFDWVDDCARVGGAVRVGVDDVVGGCGVVVGVPVAVPVVTRDPVVVPVGVGVPDPTPVGWSVVGVIAAVHCLVLW